MQAVILSFPGSNRELDARYALERVGFKTRIVPAHHADTDFSHTDLILLPGGFSHGDYLRAGALAARMPIMTAVRRAAEQGRFVVGICNGFQLLTESGLLPGALRMNAGQLFVCAQITLQLATSHRLFHGHYPKNAILEVPIAHHEGNYLVDDETRKRLEAEDRILFRYVDNPNGSVDSIAGVMNPEGNVFGLMPHPENATLPWHQTRDGLPFFAALAAGGGL